MHCFQIIERDRLSKQIVVIIWQNIYTYIKKVKKSSIDILL